MNQQTEPRFKTVGDGTGLERGEMLFPEELALASRNRGMPLEALRYPVTPTGMHYLLVHFDIPDVDAGRWRLSVGGLVSRPLAFTLDDIKKRPKKTLAVTMECAGNGRALLKPRPISQPWLYEAIGTAEWTGTPLQAVLEEAGLARSAIEILFTGLDQGVQGEELQYYQRSLAIDEAMHEDVLLAYEMNGRPLEPQHGYPLRLVVPGWYGMTGVKWLDRIEAIDRHFDGYQMERSYRYAQSADEPGEPVNTIRVRSLMVPPGIPDFMTRARLAQAGPVRLSGRAWAGRKGISRVEISTDGGATWADAKLEPHGSKYAWRGWTFDYHAKPGKHVLLVRATGSDGDVQPVEQPWNHQGMGNNMAQRVEVIVEEKF
jgi:DMSO/TMAO reductase YedYZ molybdopterin-dependent catalytic subunit